MHYLFLVNENSEIVLFSWVRDKGFYIYSITFLCEQKSSIKTRIVYSEIGKNERNTESTVHAFHIIYYYYYCKVINENNHASLRPNVQFRSKVHQLLNVRRYFVSSR